MAARKKIRSSRVNIDRELDAAVSIPIEHRKPPIRSARAARVADMFGITRFLPASLDEARRGAATYVPVPRERLRALLPGAGRIVLLTGPSGAGKSSVLRALRRMQRRSRRWVDLSRLRLPDAPLVDCFGADDVAAPTQSVLAALSRVGLAEAWSYLRTPAELSDGQRWRLRLAMVLRDLRRDCRESTGDRITCNHITGDHNTTGSGRSHLAGNPRTGNDGTGNDRGATSRSTAPASGSPAPVALVAGASRAIAPPRLTTLVCDEFAALLDRVTACVIARCLRRAVDSAAGGRACAIVATSHDDLVRALDPDVIVYCDFVRMTIEPRERHTARHPLDGSTVSRCSSRSLAPRRIPTG